MKKSERTANMVYDLMADQQQRTKTEMSIGVGVGKQGVTDAIRWLRHTLADTEDLNLVCHPQQKGEWKYQLVGNIEQARPWITNRMADCKTRLVTIRGVAASVEGREARIIKKGISRILEDIEDLDGTLI